MSTIIYFIISFFLVWVLYHIVCISLNSICYIIGFVNSFRGVIANVVKVFIFWICFYYALETHSLILYFICFVLGVVLINRLFIILDKNKSPQETMPKKYRFLGGIGFLFFAYFSDCNISDDYYDE